jgi:hypothetical protein
MTLRVFVIFKIEDRRQDSKVFKIYEGVVYVIFINVK